MEITEFIPKKVNRMGEIFELYFKAIKKYGYRVDFSVEQYQNRSIVIDRKTFHSSFYSSCRSWFLILYFLFSLTFHQEKFYKPIRIKDGIDLRIPVIALAIYLISIEISYLSVLIEILTYRLKTVKVFDALINFHESKLTYINHCRLLRNFFVARLLFGWVAKLIVFFSLILSSIVSIRSILISRDNFELIREFITALIISYVTVKHVAFIMNILFIVMVFFIFTLEFLAARLKQPIDFIESYVYDPIKIVRIRFDMMQSFVKDYAEIIWQIDRINHHTKREFFVGECIMKSLMILTAYLLQKQKKIDTLSFFVLFLTIEVAFVFNLLFYKASDLTDLNYKFYRIFTIYNARNQFVLRNKLINTRRCYFSNILKHIKTNLQIQSFPARPFGFSVEREQEKKNNQTMDLFRWKKYHIEHVSEIFEIIFKMRQKYSSRLEFTVEQYLNRSIPYNLKTFRLTIFRFVTIWTTIIILLSTILVPGFDKFISIKRLEETHHVNRLDLIYIYSVLMVISWENLSLIEFKNVIRYRNPSNEIIIHFIQFDFDRKIPKQIQNDLIKNFIKQSYIFGTIYRLICYSTFFYG
ncbi:hypothetical protein SSS_03353 [Sarcoptes scabiei]|uniref:Uncharacterized protein n=1 Tax=Sarcoptes scabiei TaxID=52283 RepID=A0A834RHY5_SARSC|nr:hypothetical protein SSS_03353 [Sarcoptes scabiei]